MRQRIQLGFCLLDMCLSSGSLFVGRGDQWTDGEFGERDGGDQRLSRQRPGVFDPAQQDQGAGVENTSGHSERRITRSSMSRRSAAGSTGGSLAQLRRSSSRGAADRGRATSWPRACGAVIVICSPRSARSTTSPPWLWRSRSRCSPCGECITRDTAFSPGRGCPEGRLGRTPRSATPPAPAAPVSGRLRGHGDIPRCSIGGPFGVRRGPSRAKGRRR